MNLNKITDKAFSKYYAPSNKIWITWRYERFPFGGGVMPQVRYRIRELLENGFKVKCGYACTSIKGAHDHYIFYKI